MFLTLLIAHVVTGTDEFTIVEETTKTYKYIGNSSKLCGYGNIATLQNLSSAFNPSTFECHTCKNGSNYDLQGVFKPAVVCGELMETCEKANEINSEIIDKLAKVSDFLKNIYTSCQDIADNEPSPETGYYTIKQGENSYNEIYCDFSGAICDGTIGWMRIGYINMEDPAGSCPDGLYEYSPGINGFHNLCDRAHDSNCAYPCGGCASTFFSSNGFNYSSICGQVRGYQYGAVDGIYDNHQGSMEIDGPYVDGVSITYGNPRKHVWTYIAGQGEQEANWEDCPCNIDNHESLGLAFVGADSYCESGTSLGVIGSTLFYLDPLWDGMKCNMLEVTCCEGDMPWFTKNYAESMSEDIELRICSSEGFPDEATPLDLVEIYVR